MKRLLILSGFLLLLLYLLQGAGNLYVYSDGPCPAGTTGSGKYIQVVKTISYIRKDTVNFACNSSQGEPGGYIACYSQSVGNNLTCHDLKAASYNHNGDVYHCIWGVITYDSLQLCKWDLP